MPDGTYKIADTVVLIRSVYDDIHRMCKDYIYDGAPEITVETTAENIDYERRKSAEQNTLEGLTVTDYGGGYLETLAVYRKFCTELIKKDTILFHGSAIAVDGKAYLFTAKSGTGKSTHTRLWREMLGDRAFMVNDDKPLIRVKNDGITVFGTPWDGKHKLSTNTSVPLKAICILKRAETNSIKKITLHEAIPILYQQTYRPSDIENMKKTMELIGLLGSSCDLYVLGCNMDPEAAKVAYEGMKDQLL